MKKLTETWKQKKVTSSQRSGKGGSQGQQGAAVPTEVTSLASGRRFLGRIPVTKTLQQPAHQNARPGQLAAGGKENQNHAHPSSAAVLSVPDMNLSLGSSFGDMDADMMCAIDKLEQDHAAKKDNQLFRNVLSPTASNHTPGVRQSPRLRGQRVSYSSNGRKLDTGKRNTSVSQTKHTRARRRSKDAMGKRSPTTPVSAIPITSPQYRSTPQDPSPVCPVQPVDAEAERQLVRTLFRQEATPRGQSPGETETASPQLLCSDSVSTELSVTDINPAAAVAVQDGSDRAEVRSEGHHPPVHVPPDTHTSPRGSPAAQSLILTTTGGSPPPASSIQVLPGQDSLSLSSWGLPDVVLQRYNEAGITRMFDWQAECLLTGDVLAGGNLVYSAPTSAGKTIVAELLILKRVLETKKKAIVILPFVSVSREKMFYLQYLFQDAGIKVGGFMGGHSPAGGLHAVDIAVCTIEKANSLVNRLLQENALDVLGIVVVDELHMIGDSGRGYLLELLLTKINFVSKKGADTADKPQGSSESPQKNAVQIIGMSATLPNLDMLAGWLKADLYKTDFRPVPLTECVKIGQTLYDSQMKKLRDIKPAFKFRGDDENIIPLCLETIMDKCSVLIFCPSKNWCEKLAESIAREFYELLRNPQLLQQQQGFVRASSLTHLPIDRQAVQDVVEQLRRTPIGVDPVLGRLVAHGVAYHHAGLTFDERDIVEGAFRQGVLKVLVATSTLSSGVNLPARRVIIRSPSFLGGIIDTLAYKQMVGRAGRKGVDIAGESILVCKPNERNKAETLVKAELPPVKSCLIKHQGEHLSSSMKRAILEIVVSGVASTPDEVTAYASCTMLAASLQAEGQQNSGNVIEACLQFLQDNEFVRLQTVTNNDGTSHEKFYPTQLGSAVLASALSPDEGLVVFAELQRARQCFVLENELHILYQVTPVYAYDLGAGIDWYNFLCMWEKLTPGMKRVAELVGVQESFLARGIRGNTHARTARQAQQAAVHRRFYTCLVLHDLVHEMPLHAVCQKYNCNRGQLQSLQQSAATFAGMVTVFCHRLGWLNLELILGQFQSRLTFGIQRELCDLVRVSVLNGQRARVMFNGGYQTVAALANADPADLEHLLRNASPFQSKKRQDGESEWEVQQRQKARCIFLTGKKGVTEYEAAEIIIAEAKALVEDDLGGVGVQWSSAQSDAPGAKSKRTKHSNSLYTSPKSARSPQSESVVVVTPPGSKRSQPLIATNLKQGAGKHDSARETVGEKPNGKDEIHKDGHESRTAETVQSNTCKMQGGQNEQSVQDGQTKQPSSSTTTKGRHSHSGSKSPSTTDLPSKRTEQFPKQDTSSVSKQAVSNCDISTRSVVTADVHVSCSGKLQKKTSVRNNDSPSNPVSKNTSVKLNKQAGKGVNRLGSVSVSSVSDSGIYCSNMSDDNQTSSTGVSAKGRQLHTKSDQSVLEKTHSNSNLSGIPANKQSQAPKDLTTKISNVEDKSQASSKENKPKQGQKPSEIIILDSELKNCSMDSNIDMGSKSTSKRMETCVVKNAEAKAKSPASAVQTKISSPDLYTLPDDFSDSFVIDTQTVQLINEESPCSGVTNISTCYDVNTDETVNDNAATEKLLDVQHPANQHLENVHHSKNPHSQHNAHIHQAYLGNHKHGIHQKKPVQPANGQQCFSVLETWAPSVKQPQFQKPAPPSAAVNAADPPRGQVTSPQFYSEEVFSEQLYSDDSFDYGQTAVNQALSDVDKGCEGCPVNADVGDLSTSYSLQPASNFEPHASYTDRTVFASESYYNLNIADMNTEAQNGVDRDDGILNAPLENENKDNPCITESETGPCITESETRPCITESETRHCITEHETRPGITENECSPCISSTYQRMQADMEGMDFDSSFSALASPDPVRPSAVRGNVEAGNVAEQDKNVLNMGDSLTMSMLEKVLDAEDVTFCDKSLSVTNIPSSKQISTATSNTNSKVNECNTGRKHSARGKRKSNETTPPCTVTATTTTPCKVSRASAHDTSISPQNVSGGSDCVPPTPPDENATKVDSPRIQLRKTPARKSQGMKKSGNVKGSSSTPNHTRLRKAAGANPGEKPRNRLFSDIPPSSAASNTTQKNQNTNSESKTGKENRNMKKGTSKQVVNPASVKTVNGLLNEHNKEAMFTLDVDNDDDMFAGEEAVVDGEEEDEATWSLRMSCSQTPDVPSTQGTFTIIDVCADQRLFHTFLREWRSKARFAISVACEHNPPPPVTPGTGIGGRYLKPAPASNRADKRVSGLAVSGSDLVIVGVAVCWENRDSYYISLSDTAEEGDADDSLAPPPLDSRISVADRLSGIRSVLDLSQGKQLSQPCVVTFDIKDQYKVLAEGCGVTLKGEVQDPKVACWVLDPGAKEKPLHRLVTNLLPAEAHLLEGLGGGFGAGSLGLTPRNPGSGRYRATVESVLCLHLMEQLAEGLKAQNLYQTFHSVEMPAIVTLARMELNGMGFSEKECESQMSVMQAKLSAIEQEAYQLARHPFSLTSTDDIIQVLYFELRLPPNGDPASVTSTKTLGPNRRRGAGGRGGGRGKPQLSTSKDVLEKLKAYHPLPGLLLEWRRISNAITKVVFPLQKEKVFCGRVAMYRIFGESSYHTATGRVTMSEPNLQNIPKDFEIQLPGVIGESPPTGVAPQRVAGGKQRGGRGTLYQKQTSRMSMGTSDMPFSVSMRHAFVPFKGGVLLAADYSQLELRMLAHMSGDEKLTRILNADTDVFKLIASQWKGLPVSQVTTEQRQQAKQVCYGMLYGIGPKALGEQLGVEEDDAAVFIETFKSKYTGMRAFIRETISKCRKTGYVETLLHRKRYLPAINDTNPHARAHAERQAVNTTIQGSAADLVKTAMIRIEEAFMKKFPDSVCTHRHHSLGRPAGIGGPIRQPAESGLCGAYLVLQLHDELIYEASEKNLPQIASLVKHHMEEAIKLSVRFPVKVKVGKSWGKLEEFEID